MVTSLEKFTFFLEGPRGASGLPGLQGVKGDRVCSCVVL